MKTTIDIADDLLWRAKERARHNRTTLRGVMEEALRRLLREREGPVAPLDLEASTFDGKGLNPEFEGRGWEAIRDLIYERP